MRPTPPATAPQASGPTATTATASVPTTRGTSTAEAQQAARQAVPQTQTVPQTTAETRTAPGPQNAGPQYGGGQYGGQHIEAQRTGTQQSTVQQIDTQHGTAQQTEAQRTAVQQDGAQRTGTPNAAPQPAEPQSTETARRTSIFSISAMMGGNTAPTERPGAKKEERQPDVDPQTEAKLSAARGAILEMLQTTRPRFWSVFEQMTVRGNRIGVSVPSHALAEELQRCRTELLMQVAQKAGVKGCMELDVEVNETFQAVKPIRLEDRVKFLMEKNPLLQRLRKELELEAE